MEPASALTAAGAALLTAGVLSWGAVAPSSELFGKTVRHTGDLSAIALTFDDGPNPAVTPALLALLDRHEAKATFFLIGKWVNAAPALAKEIAARGHAIGNHTYDHPALTFQSRARIASELERCDQAIEAATGRRTVWMRPPFGFRSPLLGGVLRQRASAGVVMWSAMARDWSPQAPEKVIRRLRHIRGGDIVLLHDGDHRVPQGDRQHTVAALDYWLPRWTDAGIRAAIPDTLYSQK
jgi:peptidoglycan/xylan/chitin deacetylase (PgdA/CDA1 family)